MKPAKKRLGILLVVLILGCWLRLWGLTSSSLWFDEAFTREVAAVADSFTIARSDVVGDLHPPLHFMLLSAWIRLMGDNDVSNRMLSVLTAFLALPAFYLMGRLLFDEQGGLWALMLGAFSPLQIYYGQEVRLYIQSVTMAAWIGVGLAAILRGKRYGSIVYFLAALGGLYTHYYTGILLAVVHIWLILYRPARRMWRQWLLLDVLIAILFLPQMLMFVRQTQAIMGSFWIEKPNPAAPLTTCCLALLYPVGLYQSALSW
jgi:mannosyltransferase